MFRLALFVILIAWAEIGWAYPDFIGYGYSSCLTCHYNSQGNGPINDYGRALFSQEIAARNFWTPKKVSDEEIAERSGFIPGVELPSWFKPSIKYRGLYLQTNPGSSTSQSRWIHMQRDFNLVSGNEAGTTVLVLNVGMTARTAQDYYGTGNNTDFVSREHYLRTYFGKKLLAAVGLMDIAYGLRTGDHTSASRAALGFGQDDQVHGLLLHWFEEKWDVSLHGFAGNLLRKEDARKQGGAIQFEREFAEKLRLGSSVYHASTKAATAQRLGVHARWGFPQGHGSSLLAELGVKQDQAKDAEAKLGSYGMIQSVINLTRGYNLITTIERAQAESKFTSPEQQRWTFGFLMFPLQRTEVRLTGVQMKTFSPEAAPEDSWNLQGQVHVSW